VIITSSSKTGTMIETRPTPLMPGSDRAEPV
jgi:hypothetical protein